MSAYAKIQCPLCGTLADELRAMPGDYPLCPECHQTKRGEYSVNEIHAIAMERAEKQKKEMDWALARIEEWRDDEVLGADLLEE